MKENYENEVLLFSTKIIPQ